MLVIDKNACVARTCACDHDLIKVADSKKSVSIYGRSKQGN